MFRSRTILRKGRRYCNRISNGKQYNNRSIRCLYSSQRLMSLLSFQSNQSITNNTKFHHNLKTNNFNFTFTHSKRSFSYPEHEVVGLPALSPSVETSKIVKWNKNEGDFVEANEAIAIVQTDKAELDWQLTDDAYLAKILLEPDVEVPVGTPACIFVEEQSDIAAFANYSPGSSSSTPEPSSPPTSPQPTQSTSPSASGGASLPSGLPEYIVEGMPALSPTAADGAIVEWSVSVGDFVEEGSSIAEIQTDKSVVTWTATDEAYVAKLLQPADGDNKLPINEPLIVFVDSKDDIAAFENIDSSAFTGDGSAAPPTEAPAPAEPTQAPQQGEFETRGRNPSIQFRHGERVSAPSPSQTTQKTGRVFASPYAKKLAKELNVDLSLISSGSAIRGRITADDVTVASKTQVTQPPKKQAAPTTPVSFEVATSDRTYEDINMSQMRQIIADRLSESKFSSPHYYVTFEFEMDNLMKMRADINDGEDIKISVNDFIIKAAALALKKVPMANVSKIGAVLRRYNYVDISVAVATPTGLITPIVKDADLKGLKAISSEVKDLAGRAKNNKLLPHEFQGGTFTISNLGMFGVKEFTAIINPPQSCILAVGGATQTLKPDPTSEKGFRTSSVMLATISSDHRSVDGALAAQYMQAFKSYIEHPAKMML